MAKGILFKSTVIAAGVKAPNDIIKFEFELNEGVTPDQIDHHTPDCLICTKAKLIGNKLVGSLDLSKAQMQYNAGKTPINKVLYVYLNDGKPRFIGKEKTKEAMVNPEKGLERLTVACVVYKK